MRCTCLFSLCFVFAANGYAAEVFKCKKGETTIYQAKPCEGAEVIVLRKEPNLSTEEVKNANAIASSEVRIGMTADQARMSWGRPISINASGSKSGRREQWVYDRGSNPSQYLYFENGILTSWN